jgi:hypothetical protein
MYHNISRQRVCAPEIGVGFERCNMTNVTRKTLSVPEAGRDYFELGRNASYEAAKRGEIPVIKVGRKLRVPIVALEAMLNGAGPQSA